MRVSLYHETNSSHRHRAFITEFACERFPGERIKHRRLCLWGRHSHYVTCTNKKVCKTTRTYTFVARHVSSQAVGAPRHKTLITIPARWVLNSNLFRRPIRASEPAQWPGSLLQHRRSFLRRRRVHYAGPSRLRGGDFQSAAPSGERKRRVRSPRPTLLLFSGGAWRGQIQTVLLRIKGSVLALSSVPRNKDGFVAEAHTFGE